MAVFLFNNNASSTLAGPINAAAVSVSLAPGTGALFPSPGANELFCLTFVDAATGLVTEIVHCTARSADTLTIVRAQEGTSAQSWNAGDTAANYWTAGSAEAMLQQGENQQQSSNYAVDGGAANAMTITLSPAPSAMTALIGAPIRVKCLANQTTAACTLNVNLLGVNSIKTTALADPGIGTFKANGIYEFVWDGTRFQYNGQINPITGALIMSPGTDNIRPVTASGLNTAFAGHNTGTGASASGYQMMPNGMILQWGKTVLPTGVNDSIGFPVSFNTAYTVAVDAGTGGTNPVIINVNTTFLAQMFAWAWFWNMGASTMNIAAGAGLGWVAVGY